MIVVQDIDVLKRSSSSIKYSSLISKGPAIVEEIPIVFKKRHKNKTKLNFIKLSRVGMDILLFKNAHLSNL